MASVQATARIAGVLYLVIFVVAAFAFLVTSTVIVSDDPGATAENLNDSETLFRVGMVAWSVVLAVEIALAAILYVLLRPVSRALSLAAAFSRLAEAVVQGVNLVTGILALMLVSGAGYLTAFEPDQLDALVLLVLEANEFLTFVWGLFFGVHLLVLGYLVCRSGFFPQVVGALLVLASLGYLAEGLGNMLWPDADAVLAIVVLVLAVPGELAFALWLLIKGIDRERWEARAREPAL